MHTERKKTGVGWGGGGSRGAGKRAEEGGRRKSATILAFIRTLFGLGDNIKNRSKQPRNAQSDIYMIAIQKDGATWLCQRAK